MAEGRYALVVASSRYADPTLRQLEAPGHDARSLSSVLSTPTIGDFNVTTLEDEPAPKVTQEIEAFFDGRRREDLVLLYFSGHGILDESARLYFATTDTRVDRPRSTAVSADFVNDLMGECRSRRQVLVLDCCNSGAFARGIKAGSTIGTGDRFEGRGRVVITASDALQYAFEGDHVEGEGIGSVFTRALVDGLRSGKADLNGDGDITLDELYDYVYGRVLDDSPRQRPRKWAFGVEGQIVVARTAVPSPAPSPPPQRAIPPSTPAPEPQAKRQWPRWRRRWIVLSVVGIVAAIAAAAIAVVLLRGGGSSEEPSPSVERERNAALRVFDAWQEKRLPSIGRSALSASARRSLTILPTEPIAPIPPASCSGDPGDVSCTFVYPGLPFNLEFTILKYSTGLRVVDVSCYNGRTGNLVKGGVAACADVIRKS
jgi:Caspase domain